MALVHCWLDLVAEHWRSLRCRALLVDETSMRRRHRCHAAAVSIPSTRWRSASGWLRIPMFGRRCCSQRRSGWAMGVASDVRAPDPPRGAAT